MRVMALRLFRTTGHSTLLFAGEARAGWHPLAVVLVVTGWIAIGANVALWHLLLQDGGSLRRVLAASLLLAGASGLVLSLFAWRRTLKPVATLLLVAAAVLACGWWSQQLPAEALWTQRPRALLPNWAAFLRGPVLLILAVLAVAPIVWVWQANVRRLPGQVQMRASLAGALLAGVTLAMGSWLALG